jgi:transmembrane sensor
VPDDTSPDDSSELDPELLERYVTGACTPAERTLVDAWVAGDPAREAELQRFARALNLWADARPTTDVSAAWSKMAKRMAAARVPVVRLHPDRVVRHHIAHRPSMSRWWWRAMAASLLIIGSGSIVVWRQLRVGSPTPAREFTAGMGERVSVTLSDGTRLTLAPASRLRVPANFGRTGGRDVMLDGEASFAVRHDAAHPFAVRTADGVIRDIGTTFVARDYTTDNELSVVVAEGSVSLQPTRAGQADTLRPRVVLLPGQRASVVPGAAPRVTAEQYAAWTTGQLVFRDTPLRQVASELSRWYDLEITVTDPSIGNLRLTTSFSDQPISEVLDAVAAALQVQVERTGRVVTIAPNHR